MSWSCEYCRRELNYGDVAYLQTQGRINVARTKVVRHHVKVVVCEACAKGDRADQEGRDDGD